MPTATAEAPRKTRERSRRRPPTRGAEVVDWIEANCVNGEGDWYGEPAVLEDFEKAFIWRLYETTRGHPRWVEALLGLGKGNGKTQIAADLAAYELFGTERIDPVVVVAAASWEQADLLFGVLRTICRESPTLADRAEVYDSEILRLDAPGRAHRIAAVAGTNEGLRPTFIVADELHEWRNERVWHVLRSGQAKRKDPMALAITTAGFDRETLCFRLYERGKRIERGDEKPEGFLFEWYEAPEGADLDDREAWRAANPALGSFLDERTLRASIRSLPPHEARRYHLNQWTTTPTEWLPRELWDELARKRRVRAETEVALSLVGSYDRGSTALVASTLDGFVFELATWERPPGDREWRTPVREVLEAVEDAMETYRVREFAPEPTGWRAEVEDLEERYGPTVVRFEIRRSVAWAAALDLFEQSVREGGLSHDGSPAIAAALSEASPVVRSSHRVLASPVPAAVAAAVIAYARARWWATSGRTGKSVYEDRGMVWV